VNPERSRMSRPVELYKFQTYFANDDYDTGPE
jgi:hypothetical protein